MVFYLQSALVTVIQAFVFSLLTSVFIKVSLEAEHKESQEEDSSIHQQLVQSIQGKPA
jgi:hypothetical protein